MVGDVVAQQQGHLVRWQVRDYDRFEERECVFDTKNEAMRRVRFLRKNEDVAKDLNAIKRDVHAVYVVRHRFFADQNDLPALSGPLHGIVCGKDNLPGGGARRRRESQAVGRHERAHPPLRHRCRRRVHPSAKSSAS